jgi:hypothetical protein
MNLVEWSKSSIDYGRKLVDSALEGARTGQGAFLEKRALTPTLGDCAKHSLDCAALGACLGAVCAYLGGRRSTRKTLACGILGGTLGFSAGMIWMTRQLTASVASGVRKNIELTRTAHWFERNPIDYA